MSRNKIIVGVPNSLAHTLRAAGVTIGLIVLPAGSFAAEPFEMRGGWEIRSFEDGCGMSMKFEGPGETVAVLLKRVNGDILLNVNNLNWSAKEGDRYDVSYVLNGKDFGGAPSVGVMNSYRPGFMVKFQPDFEQAFAAGTSLQIYLGDRRIEHLSLTGTGVAVASVNRCLARVHSRLAAEAREKARWEDLPKDPFKDAPGKLFPNSPAALLGDTSMVSSTADYPSLALRERRNGTVSWRLTIDSNGRVTGCAVQSSSGSADLDEAACATARRRGRFSPATDGQGNPTEGSFSGATTWTLPDG